MYVEHVVGLRKRKRSNLYSCRNLSQICPPPAAAVKLWLQVLPPRYTPVPPAPPGCHRRQLPSCTCLSSWQWPERAFLTRGEHVSGKPRGQSGVIPAGGHPQDSFPGPQGPGSQARRAGVRTCLQTGSLTPRTWYLAGAALKQLWRHYKSLSRSRGPEALHVSR